MTAVLWVATVLAVGCGKVDTRLRGVVTLEDKPVGNAVVQFFPERSEGGRTAATVTDAAGWFEVAVAPAAYRVTVAAQRTVGQKPDDANPSMMVDVRELITPVRYLYAKTSPLTAESIEGKTTVVNLQLTTDEQ